MPRSASDQDFSHLHRRQPKDYASSVTFRHVGAKPHPQLMERIKRLHPTVDLMWVPQVQRWALVQTDQAELHFMGLIQGPRGEYRHPDLTILDHLERMRPSNFQNQWAVDRFLDSLPEEVKDPEQDRRIEENIHEFSDRTYHLREDAPVQVQKPRG